MNKDAVQNGSLSVFFEMNMVRRSNMIGEKFGLSIKILVSAVTLVILTSCTVQLSPAYDPDLVASLNEANEETLTLFSAVSESATPDTFATHEAHYNDVLGKLSALKIQARAREVPPLSTKGVETLGKVVSIASICPHATACINPSPASIGEAITTMTKMKSTHKEKGLSAGIVEGFRNAYETSIEQALAFENVLKRE